MEQSCSPLKTLIITTTVLLFSVNILAVEYKSSITRETKIIHDGPGKSTHPYYSNDKVNAVPYERDKIFPVITEELSVGKVSDSEAKNANYSATSRPMFLVGYDPVSIDWLERNKNHLIKTNAIGFIVNVETQAQANHLMKIVDNKIYMLPTNGAELSEQLKIRHYPFYIDVKGVMR